MAIPPVRAVELQPMGAPQPPPAPPIQALPPPSAVRQSLMRQHLPAIAIGLVALTLISLVIGLRVSPDPDVRQMGGTLAIALMFMAAMGLLYLLTFSQFFRNLRQWVEDSRWCILEPMINKSIVPLTL